MVSGRSKKTSTWPSCEKSPLQFCEGTLFFCVCVSVVFPPPRRVPEKRKTVVFFGFYILRHAHMPMEVSSVLFGGFAREALGRRLWVRVHADIWMSK